ncbi:glutamine-synthetase adenylyltransferase [Pelagovum pacificum]|uniref:Glutamine-synthetase adenylyltransferase n=1 Tax=Pelagovum pacificum TaxID=2588711 RepID=A0A5C5GE43_9RHOB|nr:glutamine-synthetase adenylyltransferase [Pelagovum pacificum]QQA44418.1 glutamine-synthetase adenylyltransferase [Pelagovum pacificum]TNY32464.1 glutamine-synthetase adenylyltransferase [Pelagovum pacificum]
MSFEARITRCPDPFDKDKGEEIAAELGDTGPAVADLLKGTAGCSPYLAGLIRREQDWLLPALDDPEAALGAALDAPGEAETDDLGAALRQAKRRVALLTALADLGGVWSLEEVTGAISRLADRAVDLGLKRLLATEAERGRLPEKHGMFVLAMGKGGAFELNYSSDIDLIVLFDETQHDADAYDEVRAGFVKVTKRLVSLLSDQRSDGYVFRTDLRLRPDASVTPVCIAAGAAETYYESVGRTWERAAYIKARACAGDIAAGERFLKTLRPFVWRKHLDFAAIQDAHDMRLRIRDHKGFGRSAALPGHDMKLGRGGIREIEFFTQTRQLIAGGRDPSLQVRGTVEGLSALAAAGWVGEDVATSLTHHYRQHREVEHRLQMIGDAQTHSLPTNDEGFDRLAAFMGTDRATLKRDLSDRLEAVDSLTEGFFAPGATPPAATRFDSAVSERWQTYPALRSRRAQEIFKRIEPKLYAQLQEAARPEEALSQFDGFLRGLPAGVQLFSLFDANPQLLGLIADICSTAPALAAYLSRNAGVLDAVIGGDFFSPWPGVEHLSKDMSEEIGRATDYEAALDAARRWAKEWHFRVGVHHLRGLVGAEEVGKDYADLAEAVVAGIWPHVVAEVTRRHGPPPGHGAVVLGMGSLGARRLNATSDLDLIVIYDADGAESSDGPRPLTSRAYYAKLTQALVTALSAAMAEGRLYEVDMRLRPSGRQGPVATALSAFETYQLTEAWTWEHLALTRARTIAGDPALAKDVEAVRCKVLADRGGSRDVRADVAEMRGRIAAAKAPQGQYDAKIGRGRLQDIELCAQAATLLSGGSAREVPDQLALGATAGILTDDQAATLQRASALFWSLQSASRLLTGAPLDLDAVGEGGLRLILRETGMESVDALRQTMTELGDAAAAAIDEVLGGEHA